MSLAHRWTRAVLQVPLWRWFVRLSIVALVVSALIPLGEAIVVHRWDWTDGLLVPAIMLVQAPFQVNIRRRLVRQVLAANHPSGPGAPELTRYETFIGLGRPTPEEDEAEAARWWHERLTASAGDSDR
jgi:hypothetical protein